MNNKKSMIRVIEKEEIMRNKAYYAEKFCEGDENLKSVLMFCFDKGIETVGCCAGHTKKDGTVESIPHIVFKLCPETEIYIDNLIASLSNEEEVSLNMYRSDVKTMFRIGFSLENSERLFKEILEILQATKQEKKEQYKSQVPAPFSKLEDLLKENKDIGFGYLNKNGLGIYSISTLYDWQRKILCDCGINEMENRYRYIIRNGEESEILNIIENVRLSFEEHNRKSKKMDSFSGEEL